MTPDALPSSPDRIVIPRGATGPRRRRGPDIPLLLAGVMHRRGPPQQEIYTSPKAIRNTKGTSDTLTIPSQYPAQVSHIPIRGLGNTLQGFAHCGGQGYRETFILAGAATSPLPSLGHVPQQVPGPARQFGGMFPPGCPRRCRRRKRSSWPGLPLQASSWPAGRTLTWPRRHGWRGPSRPS